jgi:hypothetical protein
MLIAMSLTCLFAIAAIAVAASLLDTWLRGRVAYTILQRERRLLRAGFVPQIDPRETRLRQPLHEGARRAPMTRSRRGFGGVPRSQLGSVQSLG